MKPTEKQIETIDAILSIVKFWKETNDIDSPTHFGDMDTELALLEIEDEELLEISEKLTKLYIIVKNIR
jgi:hypothetical protein